MSNTGKQHQQQTVTLTVRVEADGALPDGVGKYLNSLLHDWQDGRYPQYVEMLRYSLFRCLEEAVRTAYDQAAFAEFGNEMIEYEKNAWVSRAAREANKAFKNRPAFYFNTDIDARIE